MISRFAVSSSLSLPLNEARLALVNWSLAQNNLVSKPYRSSSKFILYCDDLHDPCFHGAKKHSKLTYEEDFKWLGIEPSSTIFSSKRLDTYSVWLDYLIDKGFAYQSKLTSGKNCVFFNSKIFGTDTTFTDPLLGKVTVDESSVIDFVLQSNNYYNANFILAVNDTENDVTNVVQDSTNLQSAFIQRRLVQALGGLSPKYLHLPSFPLGFSGQRTRLEFYRNQGYLPEAMFEYLARLNYLYTMPKFTLNKFIRSYSLEKYVPLEEDFSVDELMRIQSEYMKEKSLEQKVSMVTNKFGYWAEDVANVIKVMGERFRITTDFRSFEHFVNSNLISFKIRNSALEMLPKNCLPVLEDYMEHVEVIDSKHYNKKTLQNLVIKIAIKHKMKPSQLALILRIGTTGQLSGIDVFDSMLLLSRYLVKARLEKLKNICQQTCEHYSV